MKPKTKKEGLWRIFGYEYRHIFKKGPGAAKSARNFTRKQCNKAMRSHGKEMASEGLREAFDGQ